MLKKKKKRKKSNDLKISSKTKVLSEMHLTG